MPEKEYDFGNGFIENAINTMEDIFIVFDLKGEFMMWNSSAKEVTGYTDEEIANKRPIDFFEGEDRQRVTETIARGLAEGFARVEADLVSKDGTRTHYEFYGTPLKDKHGNNIGVTAIGRDITLRNHLVEKEKEVLVARAETEAALKHASELGNLISITAHELRHPATIFKGYSRILFEYRGKMDEQAFEDALLSIEASADRLAHLATELMETSRIEQEAMKLELDVVLPSALVAMSLNKVHTFGFSYEYNILPFGRDQSAIQVDPDRLSEVLAILIENAVKYSPPGEKIDIWFEQDRQRTTFFVADRGPGIPQEYREKVFERFFQVEEPLHHSLPGIGLGLHIARCIVYAHGGEIGMEPREGGGSLFFFRLPN